MTVQSKESILLEVLRLQKDLANFVKSRNEDPATLALALYTAAHLILDEHEDGSQVIDTFVEMAPRLDAVIDLGHSAVLKTLEDGSYERIFSASVEIGAMDHESCDCDDSDYAEGELVIDERDIN